MKPSRILLTALWLATLAELHAAESTFQSQHLASGGRIYLLFEGGAGGHRAGIQVAVFNLSWLLNGRELPNLLGKRIEPK